MLVRIGKAGQVRLPTALLKYAGIKKGDLLSVRLEGGMIFLTPGGVTEGSQSYFWTEEWQRAEREADKDIEEGRVVKADTIEGLIDELGQDSS